MLALSRVASWWLFDRAAKTRSPLAGTAIWVQRALLGIGVVILAAAPDWFRANGHGIAATSMFAAIVLTVFNTAFGSPASLCGAGYRRVYQAISIAMAADVDRHGRRAPAAGQLQPQPCSWSRPP